MNINNNYIAGLVQADGSFSVTTISKKQKDKKYLNLRPVFTIVQNIKHKDLILQIKETFQNKGNWYINNKDKTIRYQVTVLQDINNIIIPFFDMYKLRSNKLESYLKFKYIIKAMINKEHIKNEDKLLSLIILANNLNPLGKRGTNIRYLNKQNQELVKLNQHPKTINITDLNNEIEKTKKLQQEKQDPITKEFINGLFDGDGNISVYFISTKDINNNLTLRIRFTYSIVQDIYNESLLTEIKEFNENIGNIYKISKNCSRYDIKKLKDIEQIITKLLTGNTPIIKKDKLKNTLKLIEIVKENKGKLTKDLNKIIELSYTIISNKNNINFIEYKNKIKNKVSVPETR